MSDFLVRPIDICDLNGDTKYQRFISMPRDAIMGIDSLGHLIVNDMTQGLNFPARIAYYVMQKYAITLVDGTVFSQELMKSSTEVKWEDIERIKFFNAQVELMIGNGLGYKWQHFPSISTLRSQTTSLRTIAEESERDVMTSEFDFYSTLTGAKLDINNSIGDMAKQMGQRYILPMTVVRRVPTQMELTCQQIERTLLEESKEDFTERFKTAINALTPDYQFLERHHALATNELAIYNQRGVVITYLIIHSTKFTHEQLSQDDQRQVYFPRILDRFPVQKYVVFAGGDGSEARLYQSKEYTSIDQVLVLGKGQWHRFKELGMFLGIQKPGISIEILGRHLHGCLGKLFV